jgi:hypothetical protein
MKTLIAKPLRNPWSKRFDFNIALSRKLLRFNTLFSSVGTSLLAVITSSVSWTKTFSSISEIFEKF